MRATTSGLIAAGLVCLAPMGSTMAQGANPFEQSEDAILQVEEDLLAEDDGSSVRIYGFIEGYFEKVARTPAGVDAGGNTVFEDNPHEFDVANAHLMVQGVIANREELEAITLYSYEQGLTPRKLELSEVFSPNTLDK